MPEKTKMFTFPIFHLLCRPSAQIVHLLSYLYSVKLVLFFCITVPKYPIFVVGYYYPS